MKKLFALLLALSLTLSCTAFAANTDYFNAGLTFGEDAAGNKTVTVEDSSILASQRPTLTIPCDYENAYVTYNGKSVTSSLQNGAITFVVAAGGTYTIMEGIDPTLPQPDPTPTPDPDPEPDPDPTPTPDPGTTPAPEISLGTGTSTGADSETPAPSIDVPANVEVNNGNAQITMDSEKLAESLAQQTQQTTPPAEDEGTDLPSDGESTDTPAPAPVTVQIDLSASEESVQTVTVDTASVAVIADAAADPDNAVAGLTVKVEAGEVTLDSEVLSQVASAGEPLSVSLAPAEPEGLTQKQQNIVGDMPVIEITVTAGDKELTDLGDGRIHASLPYTPTENETLDNLVVWRVLDDGTLVPISCVYENGKVVFVLDHLSHYVIVSFPFSDVSNTWYYGDVAYAWTKGLMNGTGATTFSPNATTSRGMIVTILWRLEGMPTAGACTFADVKAGSYYEQAIAWAAENGIVNGYGPDSFRPDGTITREQFATILYRYAKDYKGYDVSVGEDTNILSYTDAFSISDYAFPALQWACGSGLMNGSGTSLMPSGSATRAQAAALLHRFCENMN